MSPRTGIIIYFNAHKDYGFITADGRAFRAYQNIVVELEKPTT